MLPLLAKCGRSVLSPFVKHDRGATAVEFAFVGAPFFYLLGSIFEMGLMLFSEYTLENSTAEAGRLIRTGQAQTSGMSAAQFKTKICDNVVLMDCASKLYVDVRKYASFSAVSTPNSITTDANGNQEISTDIKSGAQFQTGGPGDVIVVRVYYDWTLFIPQIPGLSNLANLTGNRRLLTASFAFRNEPYQTN